MFTALHLLNQPSLLGGEMEWKSEWVSWKLLSFQLLKCSCNLQIIQLQWIFITDAEEKKQSHIDFSHSQLSTHQQNPFSSDKFQSRIALAVKFFFHLILIRVFSCWTRNSVYHMSERVYGEKFTIFTFSPPFCKLNSLFSCFIYSSSVDLRERDPKAAKRWSDDTVFSNRAYFLFDKLPGELAVQNVKDSDTGKINNFQLKFTICAVCWPTQTA